MDPFDSVEKHVLAGRFGRARHELASILETDPRSSRAWFMLGALLEDFGRRADCYRRALRADPDNRQALYALQDLTGEGQPAREWEAVRCPCCNAPMQVRFLGELRDKRAVCRYCGSEVDLPDSYRRVRVQREQQGRGRNRRLVETTVIETRSDAGPGVVSGIEVRNETYRHRPPGLWAMLLEASDRGFEVGIDGSDEVVGDDEIKPLTALEIIALAGGAPPLSERRECPKCSAVIPRKATWCEWCGEHF